ncbi:CRISPR-associated endonuclease Cas3'' [Streptomyces rhizosphaericus]|uniref:HD Cas3-type domain-containing protein n=2 Tax=Streptomyces rhizosphaericus TaxID=114699 RepID=A0ABP4D0A7_9ACTN
MAEMPLVPAGTGLDARLWGKEKGLLRPYPLICHLLDTAAVAGRLWDVMLGARSRGLIAERLGLGEDASRRLVCCWAGLHDLGKITPPFQSMSASRYAVLAADEAYAPVPGAEGKRGLRHERATHWALTGLFAEWGYPHGRLSQSVAHQVAQLLGGHHGVFGCALEASKLRAPEVWEPGLGGPGWAGQRAVHAGVVRALTGAGGAPSGRLSGEAAVVVAGVVVVADWLASQESVIAERLPTEGWAGDGKELAAHWREAVEAAERVVGEAGLGSAVFPARSFAGQFPFSANALQESVERGLPGLVGERGSGLVLVTAPTGDGKTEAALHAASVLGGGVSGAGGVFVALPTMATADAMVPRGEEFARMNVGGDRALVLLHNMAWLSRWGGSDQGDHGPVVADGVTALEAGEWLRGGRRGLLAPLGVGTVLSQCTWQTVGY